MMHHFAAKVTTDETFELGFTKQEKRGREEEVCYVNSMKNEGPF